MSWIRHVAPEEASPELAGLYDRVRDPATGVLDEIMSVHSLHPAGLAAHFGLYRAVMRGTRGLPLADRELIALVVSDLNGCEY